MLVLQLNATSSKFCSQFNSIICILIINVVSEHLFINFLCQNILVSLFIYGHWCGF